MDRKYRVGVIAALLISVVTSVMLLINPALTAQLIDQVIIAENTEPLLRLLTIMLVAKVLREGLRYLMIVCLEKGSQNVVFNLRRRLFAVLQYQEMRFFDRNRTGDLMTRLSADLDWCRHFVSYLAYMVVDCSVMFLSTLLFFFTVSWKLTLALLAVTPLLLLITKLYSSKVRPLFIGMRERLAEMNTAAQENIAGNRVVKAFAREEFEKERFRKKNEAYRDANLEINKLWLTFYPFIELLANAMTLITVFLGGFFIIIGEISPGELTIFTSLSWALANPMRNLGNLINDLQRFAASANKVIEVYYARPLIMDRTDAVDHAAMEGKIEFRDVSFSFGRVQVLDHVSFTA